MKNSTIIFRKKVSLYNLEYIPLKNNFNDYLDEQFNNNVNPFKNIALNTKMLNNNIKKDLDYIINNSKKKDDNDFLSDLILVQNINEYTFKKDLNNLKKSVKSDPINDNKQFIIDFGKEKIISDKTDIDKKKNRVQTAIRRDVTKSSFHNQKHEIPIKNS